MGLTASVAMSTYRGADHLQEQLDSLARQTRLPDEMVVCDDGSSDGTLDLLEGFRSRSSFPVNVNRNPGRLGPTKSFERALSLCRGEIIFLCDQDDVWSRVKVERVLAAFKSSPAIGGVFSDATLLDERSRPTRRRLWSAIGITARWQRRFSSGDRAMRVRLLAQRNAVSGATLALRSGFRDLLLPMPDGWGHDEWIALLLAAVSDLRMIAEPLVGYRIHLGQKVGLGRHPTLAGRVRSLSTSRPEQSRRRTELMARADLLDLARERLVDHSVSSRTTPGVLWVLTSHAGHLRTRGRMDARSPRWHAVLRELTSGRYHRHSRGWASAARDLLDRR